MSRWPQRFLALAQLVSTWSKDPSTRVGAVIVDDEQRIIGVGFNGFARKILDDDRLENRDIKYDMIIHGEINAILNSNKSVKGCTLYTWPFQPCSRCAALLIQSGIKKVVTVAPTEEQQKRWGDNFKLAQALFAEAGVSYIEVNYDN